MYSPLGLVIFVGVEGTFERFTKGHDNFHFKHYLLRLLMPKPTQYREPSNQRGDELCLVIYAVRVCRLPPLFSIMFLDTFCSKKWYDMRYATPRVWYSFASAVHDFPHW